MRSLLLKSGDNIESIDQSDPFYSFAIQQKQSSTRVHDSIECMEGFDEGNDEGGDKVGSDIVDAKETMQSSTLPKDLLWEAQVALENTDSGKQLNPIVPFIRHLDAHECMEGFGERKDEVGDNECLDSEDNKETTEANLHLVHLSTKTCFHFYGWR